MCKVVCVCVCVCVCVVGGGGWKMNQKKILRLIDSLTYFWWLFNAHSIIFAENVNGNWHAFAV